MLSRAPIQVSGLSLGDLFGESKPAQAVTQASSDVSQASSDVSQTSADVSATAAQFALLAKVGVVLLIAGAGVFAYSKLK